MRIRTSLRLPARSIALEVFIATLSGLSVSAVSWGPDGGVLPVPLMATASLVLAVLLFLLRRTAPLVPFLIAAALSAFSPAIGGALPVTAYAVGRYSGRSSVRIVAAVAGTLAVTRWWLVPDLEDALNAMATVAFIVFLPGAVGAYVRTRADLMDALQSRAERAEAEQELLAKDAVLTERTRIAREMHDAVGHRVSLMVLQAGAIEMAAGDRAKVEHLASEVQVAGRQALEELRQAVGVLRAGEDDGAPLSPQPGLDDLERLVKEWRAAGMTVELHRPPDDAAPVDATVSRAAYRIAQEALTNAGRHAPGAPVTVDVERPEGQVVIRVVNGRGRAAGQSRRRVRPGRPPRARAHARRDAARRAAAGRRLRRRGGAARMTIRVLLVDDEELVRFGLRTVLEASGDFDVVGEAGDGAAAVRAAHELRPDVVLMDIRMPVMDGLAATREILALPHPPQVAVLTTFHADEYVYAALAAGAAGFLLKDTPPREIASAVRAVADGTATLSPAVTSKLIDSYVDRAATPRRQQARRRLAELSEREQEVLRLLGRGESNATIAGRLFVSEATVKTYVSRLLGKLQLSNRTQAAILAHEAGLLDS